MLESTLLSALCLHTHVTLTDIADEPGPEAELARYAASATSGCKANATTRAIMNGASEPCAIEGNERLNCFIYRCRVQLLAASVIR
eukprot:6173050-Pleurochrysis_carterae.AAC.3